MAVARIKRNEKEAAEKRFPRLFGETGLIEVIDEPRNSKHVLFCVLGNGTISTDAEAVEIIESSGSFAEICRKLHEAQPLVDYIGGSGITRLEYWFDNKGAQKIYLIMEEESIFYFHFTGADIVYS